MKICLDAGHSVGQNQSPANSRYFEGERMFLLQKFLKAELERYGFQVVCTRKQVEDNPGLYERARTARGCSLLLSLHTNAIGSSGCSSTVDHVRVYYPVSRCGQELAQAMAELIASVMGTVQQPSAVCRYNSAGDADYYGVIRHAATFGVTALLLEHSFHTHPKSTEWLLRDENLYRLAQAEAALLGEYYGLEGPELRYEMLKDIQSEDYRQTLEKLLARNILHGKSGKGEETVLDLGEDAVRVLVLLDRAGLFG